jgi:hypothetical protein
MKSRFELYGVFYDLKSDGTATVVGCTTDAPKILAFPKTVFGNGREFVVQWISELKGWNGAKVAIPRTIEFIEEYCFYDCNSLKEVIFESDSNLKRIDKSAFSSSGLKSVRIPAKVEFIGERCFYMCHSLGEVIFCGVGEIEIGKAAFDQCPVRYVEVPVG